MPDEVRYFDRAVIYDTETKSYMVSMTFTEHEVRAIAMMLEAGCGVVGRGYTATLIQDQFAKAYREVARENL